MLIFVAALVNVAAAPCPAERAIYRLRGVPGVTAGFTRQRYQINFASDLFFWVRTADGRRWWFSMNSPNGYGGPFLSPDVDATKITKADREADQSSSPGSSIEVDFDMFDRNYGVITTPPQEGGRAPSHLYARGLGSLMWYNPVGAANGDKRAKAGSIPIAMYDLKSCLLKR
ncbi:MAG: hypothetical protein H7315_01580 [Herminiimonas sp.]|nr:hypothetical protein [Herminiimonas sp.]